MSAELVQAVAELVSAVIWPAIVIVVLFTYRDSVRGILANLEVMVAARYFRSSDIRTVIEGQVAEVRKTLAQEDRPRHRAAVLDDIQKELTASE